MSLAFVDTETTGLDLARHHVWEVGLIVDGTEYEWQLLSDLRTADPGALRVSRYYERIVDRKRVMPEAVAHQVATLTANRHLVGMNPAFDASFLSKFLEAYGYRDAWHYHLIDLEAVMLGWLSARGETVEIPWKSTDLSARVGVNPDLYDRHTALGDARWAQAVYRAVSP